VISAGECLHHLEVALTRYEIARDGVAHVSAGDEVVVRLIENPGTGYRWDIEQLPDGVQVISSELERTGGDAPGAGGHRVVTLRATEPVDGQVRFVLARSWETGRAPAGDFTVTLHQRSESEQA
jgi:predicted secreted protein